MRLGERVDRRLLERRDATERPEDHPVRERRRPVDEVVVGHLAVVAGRQEQVAAALAAVGSGEAHVGHVAEPEVVDDAQRLLRRLDHHRPVGPQVEEHRAVRGLGVRGEEEAPRARAGVGVGELVRSGEADAAEATSHGDERGARDGVEEDLDAAQEVEPVVQPRDRVTDRDAVEQRELPQRCRQVGRSADGLPRLRQVCHVRPPRVVAARATWSEGSARGRSPPERFQPFSGSGTRTVARLTRRFPCPSSTRYGASSSPSPAWIAARSSVVT